MGESLITVKSFDDANNNDDAYSENDEGFQHEAKSNKVDILAEILAAGIQLQETIYETAKLGVSERFGQYLSQLTTKLQELDRKYKVVETVVHKASEIDNKFSVQDKVRSYASQAQDKATQALNSETGKYAQELYANTYKQIGVIQCQARKIANDKKAKIGDSINSGIEAH